MKRLPILKTLFILDDLSDEKIQEVLKSIETSGSIDAYNEIIQILTTYLKPYSLKQFFYILVSSIIKSAGACSGIVILNPRLWK